MANKSREPRRTAFSFGSILGALASGVALVFSPLTLMLPSSTDAHDATGEAAWQRVRALGSADAVQEFIGENSESPWIADAFDVLVVSELAAANLPENPDDGYLTVAQTVLPEDSYDLPEDSYDLPEDSYDLSVDSTY